MKNLIGLVLLALSLIASTVAIARADTLNLKHSHSPFTEMDRRHKKG